MTKDVFLKLIDIVRDMNKTTSRLIDNPGSMPVAVSCMRVCKAVSADLGILEQEVKRDKQ